MLRENVYEQVRLQFKPFQNTRFQITYNNEYFIWICLYNFLYLKEMVIIRAVGQSILDKQQMNKGWKITYVLRVVNAMIHRIWISHRPIVGRKYSAIFGLKFRYGYVVKPKYLFQFNFIYLKGPNQTIKINLDYTRWKVHLHCIREDHTGLRGLNHRRKPTFSIGNNLKRLGIYLIP